VPQGDHQTFQERLPTHGRPLSGGRVESTRLATDHRSVVNGQAKILKGLILAQNERWRRGLGMQVEREPGGNPGGKWRKGQ
jgi:hypothetical protein